MNPPTLGRPRASFSEIAGTQLDGSADQRRVGEPLELAGCREQVGALVEPTPRTIEIASEHRHEATVVEVVPESIRQAQASIEIERAVVVGLRGGEVVLPIGEAAGGRVSGSNDGRIEVGLRLPW